MTLSSDINPQRAEITSAEPESKELERFAGCKLLRSSGFLRRRYVREG